MTVSTIACTLLVMAAAAATTPFEQAAYTFLTAMTALAIVEHWFLILPLPFERLWSWSLGSRKEPTRTGARAAVRATPMPIAPCDRQRQIGRAGSRGDNPMGDDMTVFDAFFLSEKACCLA